MQTYPLSALAEQFEVDRSTMVRAMRNVAPDLVKPGNRPTWKTATSALALEAHRRNKIGDTGTGTPSNTNPALQSKSDELDNIDATLRAAPTLEQRRKLAGRLFVTLSDVDRACHSSARGDELATYRNDAHSRAILATLREPCGWNLEQVHAEFDAATMAEVL